MATQLPPGVFVGSIYRPTSTTTNGFTRQPCIVGKGSRFKVVRENLLKRGFREGIELSFSSGNPPKALIPDYPSDGNQAGDSRFPIRLYKSDNTEVSTSKWFFSTSVVENDTVTILATAYDNAATYLLDYQTTSTEILDELPFDGVREMLRVGDNPNEVKYIEGKDFLIPTSVTLSTPTISQTAKSVSAIAVGGTNTSTGLPAFGLTTAYSAEYHRQFTLTVVQAGTEVDAIVEWSSTPISLGVNAALPNPIHPLVEATQIDLSGGNTNVLLENGISLDFGTGTYVLGDTWTFDGLGPGTVELAAEYSNTNQHSEVSLTTGLQAGTGVLSLWGNTDFSGEKNRSYSAEVVQLTPVPAYSRSADAPDNGTGLSGAANQFGVLVDEDAAGVQQVILNTASTTDFVSTALEIQAQVQALGGVYAGVSCEYVEANGSSYYELQAGSSGLNSSIVISAGLANDASVLLKVGAANGGVEVTGESVPGVPGKCVGAATTTSALTIATVNLQLTIDGEAAAIVLTPPHATVAAIITDLETAIQAASTSTGFTGAKVFWRGSAVGVGSFEIQSGTLGANSSVNVVPFATNDAAAILGLGTAAGATETAGNREVTIAWASIGIDGLNQGILSFDDSTSLYNNTLELGVGVNADFGTSNFALGDNWSLSALAPQSIYGAKDARMYTFRISATSDTTSEVFYYTDTLEGGGGTVNLTPTSTESSQLLELPDNIVMVLSNLGGATGWGQFTVGDEWILTTSLSVGLKGYALLDWTLTARVPETIELDEIKTDVLGNATGEPGAYFFILKNIPVGTPLWVRTSDTYEDVTFTHTTGTSYIKLDAIPSVDLVVKYDWSAQEPDSGDVYYIDAKQLRPAEDYNTPIRVLDLDGLQDNVGPAETSNHLMIAGRIMFGQSPAPEALWYVQVADADSDGFFVDNDYITAVEATELKSEITDIVVLSRYSVLAEALSSIETENQPYRKHQRMLWVGVPAGTVIGDENTDDSLVQLSRKTLQFSGNSPGRGRVILIANNTVSYDMQISDGSSTTITLDGSFIAAAVCALNAGLTLDSSANTVLRQNLGGSLKDMNVYTEAEISQLQKNSVLYISNQGSDTVPAYRCEESYTVDESLPYLHEISAGNQIINADKFISSSLDAALIGYVPPGPQAGEALIRSYLAEALLDLLSDGEIGQYTDDAGNERELNTSTDMDVFPDPDDSRLYNIRYWFNVRQPIKRISGLYSVDSRIFSSNVLNDG